MKTILNIRNTGLVLLIAASMALSSCSSNNEGTAVNNYANIFMPQARQTPSHHSIIFSDTSQSITYGAVYGGASGAPNDISVQFSVDPSLVSSFDARHNVSYTILPKNSYELSKTSAVIQAGQVSTPALTVQFHNVKDNLTEGTPYLLPVTMTVEGGNVPVNKKLQTAYFVITAKSPTVQLPTNPPPDETKWKVVGFSSQYNSTNYSAAKVIDGKADASYSNAGSFWLTTAALPQTVTLDMGATYTIQGFKIQGNPVSSSSSTYQDRNPKRIKIEFSNDGNTFGNAAIFNLPFTKQNVTPAVTKTKVKLPKPVQARYIKVIVLKTVGGQAIMNFAEISAF
jgi:hypothetical protein